MSRESVGFNFSELLADSINDSDNYNLTANKLIIKYVINYSQLPTRLRDELFIKIANIWRIKGRRETFIALCRMRAASSNMLLESTGLTGNDLSRGLKYLRLEGLVKAAQKVKVYGIKGGPKHTIWGILGYTPDDVTKAIQTHLKMSTPAYGEAERITQLLLDDYIPNLPQFQKDLRFKEIHTFVKRKSTGYDTYTVARLVARRLHRKGVKVVY